MRLGVGWTVKSSDVMCGGLNSTRIHCHATLSRELERSTGAAITREKIDVKYYVVTSHLGEDGC